MRLVTFAIALALAVPIGPLLAQDCNALLTHGLRNVEITRSTDAMVATKYYRNCGLDYSSRNDTQLAEVEAEVFGYGKGAAGYSRQQREEALKQWCVQNEATAQAAKTLYQEAHTIYAEALQAWSSCNALLKDQVQTSHLISADQKTVDLSIRYTGPGQPLFYGVDVENFTCDTRIPGMTSAQAKAAVAKGVILGPSAISVNCRRTAAAPKTVEGQVFLWLERATISVRTASYPYQLFFPERTTPTLPTETATRIEARLDSAFRVLAPVGAVVAFALTPAEVDALAPHWLPADGRIVNDQASPLNNRPLPNMVGRLPLGLALGQNAADNANSGGTRTIDQKVKIEGVTSGMKIENCTHYMDDPRHQYEGTNMAVWDTKIQEAGCDHRHRVTGEYNVSTELPFQPYRALVYLVRVR